MGNVAFAMGRHTFAMGSITVTMGRYTVAMGSITFEMGRSRMPMGSLALAYYGHRFRKEDSNVQVQATLPDSRFGNSVNGGVPRERERLSAKQLGHGSNLNDGNGVSTIGTLDES